MRRTMTFEGKRHSYDTEKSTKLAHKTFGEFGDPAGYEETLYRNRSGFYFLYGQGGEDSPYKGGEDLKPISESQARSWEKE
ncbi:MAG: hypothetical protein DUD39_09075 [Coriobacteriaceae bacterium]|jgi:hypothetical protein|uniref:hypothetical protein n=1 Tax=Atopobium sp. oral taxon 416 TaxID=712157 RepID=UPI000FEEF890|nr:hypothetical protein [Atopobium sp. oral taxon 416]QUC04412.1 hypothetical protein J4859_05630 [Atopobium sp. oral taxon 416]RRF98553.1 MAG: hypothetical protein DUD39_09075 [Coriobacteriaceae bacterium]